MNYLAKALGELRPQEGMIYNSELPPIASKIIYDSKSTVRITQEELDNKIQEIKDRQPLRLLRIERNRLLQETDWEITRGLEEGLNIDSLKTYRTALRNLPQQIEAGEITAPTLDDNGMLVFEHWPERTDA